MVAVMKPNRQTEWTAKAIEDVVLDLLADLLHEERGELRKRLLEKGMAMPIDSLDLFDVLQEFRTKTGLQVPVRKLRRRTMRSVRAFADFVAKEVEE